MIFINKTTGEYPRFRGDVDLDPTADWAEVVETNQPEPRPGFRFVETVPEFIDGQFFQAWIEEETPPPNPFLER